MVPNFNVTGKVYVITGATGVLCSEMVRELAEAGAKVAILSRTAEKVKELADEITKAGGDAVGIACDVVDKDSMIRAKDAVMARFGRVDCLIQRSRRQSSQSHRY